MCSFEGAAEVGEFAGTRFGDDSGAAGIEELWSDA